MLAPRSTTKVSLVSAAPARVSKPAKETPPTKRTGTARLAAEVSTVNESSPAPPATSIAVTAAAARVDAVPSTVRTRSEPAAASVTTQADGAGAATGAAAEVVDGDAVAGELAAVEVVAVEVVVVVVALEVVAAGVGAAVVVAGAAVI